LSQYLKLFPRDNIHVVLLERMMRDSRPVLRGVFRFLGVDENFWNDAYGRAFNPGESKMRPGEWYMRLIPRALRRRIGSEGWIPHPLARALQRLSLIGGRPINKPKLSPAQDLHLQSLLRDDVARLRDYLGDSLSEWRAYA